jgi:phage terminase small subunit
MTSETPAPEPKPEKTPYQKLSRRLRRFVDGLVAGETGADAARAAGAGDQNAKHWAYKMRQRPDVRAAIEEREAAAAEEAGITQTRIYRELAHVAFFDHRKLYDPEGNPLPIHQLPPEVSAGLASTEVEELFEGRGESRKQVGRIHKYRAWSKTDALKLLAQAKRMLPQQHEHGGPNGTPLPVAPVYVIAQEEAKAIEQDLDERI